MAVRVLLVEDSPTTLRMLEALIASDPRLEVVGTATSGEEALTLVSVVKPDVISMDLQLPGLSGLETVQRIMAEHPTPVVVVAQSVDASTLEALRCGVLTLVEKPSGAGAEYSAMCRAICDQLYLMSSVRVMRYRAQKIIPLNASQARLEKERSGAPRVEVLGVGARTGSTPALVRLLGSLPRRFELPVLLAQRFPLGQIGAYVDWFQTLTTLPVRVATNGDIPLPGYVYLAPAGQDLGFEERRLSLVPAGESSPCNVLFHSLAALGSRAVGILLLGMTTDGELGLTALHAAGGETLVEIESSFMQFSRTVDVPARHRLPVDSLTQQVLKLLR